jgi:hypothetical protein
MAVKWRWSQREISTYSQTGGDGLYSVGTKLGDTMSEHPDQEYLKKQDNIFVRLFNGDISLPVTYWVWGALGGMGFAIVSVLLEENIFQISALPYGPSFLTTFYWIWIAYAVFVWIAIWRSADKHKGSGFWAGAAKVMVVLGVVSSIGQLATEFGSSSYSDTELYSDTKLAKDEAALNRGLPTMLTESLRVDSVELSPSEFRYYYTIVDQVVDDMNPGLFKLQTQVAVTQAACTENDSRRELESGIDYLYVYRDSVGSPVAEFRVVLSDCN